MRKRIEAARAVEIALNERGQGRKRYRAVAELREAAMAVMKKHQVEGLLSRTVCMPRTPSATARLTAEHLLETFKGLTLTLIREPCRCVYHLTPLSDLQRRILDLLDFTPDVYTRLCANSLKPP